MQNKNIIPRGWYFFVCFLYDNKKNIIRGSMNKKEKQRKILQYLMLILLYGAAFLLPRYAVSLQKDQALESAGKVKQTETEETEQPEQPSGMKGTIVLDSGHGGDDPGMIGDSGINEKVLNLVYARKLQALLEQEGYRVVMTRETEDGLYDAGTTHPKAQDMQRRVAIIAEEKPLLTVSIHQNSYPDSSVCGPQVFYYEHSAEGEKLAKAIQETLNAVPEILRAREAKANGSYYILKRSEGTAVIVECGFLSNPSEEALLQQETYQDKIVQGIYNGIMKYLEE